MQAEMDCLANEVVAAVGLGGRHREKTDADRFRRSVAMAIGRAIKNIEAAHAELGRHLMAAVCTGQFLCYAPETPIERDL